MPTALSPALFLRGEGKKAKKPWPAQSESITSNMTAFQAQMFKVRPREIKALMGSGCFPGTWRAMIQMLRRPAAAGPAAPAKPGLLAAGSWPSQAAPPYGTSLPGPLTTGFGSPFHKAHRAKWGRFADRRDRSSSKINIPFEMRTYRAPRNSSQDIFHGNTAISLRRLPDCRLLPFDLPWTPLPSSEKRVWK